MKAAVFYGARDVRVEEVETPKLDPGDVLLRIKACGICGSDLHTYKLGDFPAVATDVGDGRIMGHEFSGEIAALGGEVEGLKVGDRIVTIGAGANAEFVKVPASMRPILIPLPPEVSFEVAATNEPLATSLHAVNLAKPADGQTIVIIGAGIIGLGVLQVLKSSCSVKVIVVDLSDKRLAMAKDLGADVLINARGVDLYQKVLEVTGSNELSLLPVSFGNVDTVFDCAGNPTGHTGTPVLWQALTMVKQDGTVVMVAIYEKDPEIQYNLVVRKGIRMLGSWGWGFEEFVQSLELIRSGKIDRRPLITHEFSLDEVKDAYETQLKAEEAIKVIIKP